MGSGLIDTFLSHMRNGAHDKAMETLSEINRLGQDVRRHLAQRKQELDTESRDLLVELDLAAKRVDDLQRQIDSHGDSVDGLKLERTLSLERQQHGEVQRSLAERVSQEAETIRQKAVRQLHVNRFVLLIPIIGIFVFAITNHKNKKTILDSQEKTAESNRLRKEAKRLVKREKRTQSECEEEIERLTSEMQSCRENQRDRHRRISEIKEQLGFIYQGLSVCEEVALYTKHASEQTTSITDDYKALSAQSVHTVATSGAFISTIRYYKMAWQKVSLKSQDNLEYLGDIPASLENHFLKGTTAILHDESLSKGHTGLDATTKFAMVFNNVVFLCLAYNFSSLITFVASWVLVNIWFELFYILLSPPLTIIWVGVETCLDVVTPILKTLVETVANSKLAKPLVFFCKLAGHIVYIICTVVSFCYRFVGVYYTFQFLWVGTALSYLLAKRIQTPTI